MTQKQLSEIKDEIQYRKSEDCQMCERCYYVDLERIKPIILKCYFMTIPFRVSMKNKCDKYQSCEQ